MAPDTKEQDVKLPKVDPDVEIFCVMQLAHTSTYKKRVDGKVIDKTIRYRARIHNPNAAYAEVRVNKKLEPEKYKACAEDAANKKSPVITRTEFVEIVNPEAAKSDLMLKTALKENTAMSQNLASTEAKLIKVQNEIEELKKQNKG
jgi:hypothetical protein